MNVLRKPRWWGWVLGLGLALASEVVFHHSEIVHVHTTSHVASLAQHSSEAAPDYTPMLPGVDGYVLRISPDIPERDFLPVREYPLPEPAPLRWLRTVVLLC